MSRIHDTFSLLRGWKATILAGLLAATPLLIEALNQLQGIDLTPIFKEHAPAITSVMGIVLFLLRVYSVGSLGNNGPRS